MKGGEEQWAGNYVPGRSKGGVGSGTIDNVYLEVENLVFGFMLAAALENLRAMWRSGGDGGEG